MSEREQHLAQSILEAVRNMSTGDQRYFLGLAEGMALEVANQLLDVTAE